VVERFLACVREVAASLDGKQEASGAPIEVQGFLKVKSAIDFYDRRGGTALKADVPAGGRERPAQPRPAVATTGRLSLSERRRSPRPPSTAKAG
jgi:hypothetical protein